MVVLDTISTRREVLLRAEQHFKELTGVALRRPSVPLPEAGLLVWRDPRRSDHRC
jgi:hypothetical protein